MSLVPLYFRIYQQVLRRRHGIEKRLNPGSRLLLTPLSTLAWLFSDVNYLRSEGSPVTVTKEETVIQRNYHSVTSFCRDFVNMQREGRQLRSIQHQKEREKEGKCLSMRERSFAGYVHNILSDHKHGYTDNEILMYCI